MKNNVTEAENQFIRQLEAFLGDSLGDYGRGRVISHLEEYRSNLAAQMPPKEILRTVDMIIAKEPCSDRVMEIQGRKLCEERGLDYKIFRKSLKGKSDADYTDARKRYSQMMFDNFLVSRKRLEKFFSVDHASISFYINSRNYRKIRKQLQKTA